VDFKGKRILIVEDEVLISMWLESELAALGGEVLTAVSVEEAIDFIASTQLDGAIVDLKLRGDRSFEIADALATRRVPWVIVTAQAQSAAPARYADVPWIEKPYLPMVVCDALDRVMRSER
jgi:CheY-like chemotaxis protein